MNEHLKIGLITAAILIVIMLISSYKIWPEIKQEGLYHFQEGPLNKSELRLAAGETYVYEYNVGKQAVNITFSLRTSGNCLQVVMAEMKNIPLPCIDNDGTDASKSNVTLANPMVFFFKPWMLALTDGWDWEVITYSGLGGREIDRFEFKEVGMETYANRSVYLVQGKINDTVIVTYKIDKEKRIVLAENGEDYSIKLITAPFPLTPQAG